LSVAARRFHCRVRPEIELEDTPLKGSKLTVITAALALAVSPATAQGVVVLPTGDIIVLTDPVVRTTQLGYTPVGSLLTLDPRTGMALVALPEAGERWVRLLGRPVATPSGLTAAGVDLRSGISLHVRIPVVDQRLTRATVLRVSPNGVTVRRRGAPSTDAEVLPHANVYLTRNGWTTPARLLGVQLAPGTSVLVPAVGGAGGAIRVERRARATTGARRR
jgi:hypothetical protein